MKDCRYSVFHFQHCFSSDKCCMYNSSLALCLVCAKSFDFQSHVWYTWSLMAKMSFPSFDLGYVYVIVEFTQFILDNVRDDIVFWNTAMLTWLFYSRIVDVDLYSFSMPSHYIKHVMNNFSVNCFWKILSGDIVWVIPFCLKELNNMLHRLQTYSPVCRL